jgi:hypothetical protein
LFTRNFVPDCSHSQALAPELDHLDYKSLGFLIWTFLSLLSCANSTIFREPFSNILPGKLLSRYLQYYSISSCSTLNIRWKMECSIQLGCRLVEWNIPSFTSWKYSYHCTHKHSLSVYHYIATYFLTDCVYATAIGWKRNLTQIRKCHIATSCMYITVSRIQYFLLLSVENHWIIGRYN